MDEWGFVEVREEARKYLATDPRVQGLVLEFLEKLEILRSGINLITGCTGILSSPWKLDLLDDIQQLGSILEKFGPSQAVEKLKSKTKRFLREANEN